ncbi:Hypp7559 [Branchiostoma lanceolatum]|uniref:Hypp7559 protein n=1 Tax=Branchiostoma lanceolatum TaxID=7740 RepID=A0A8J9Z280_BRALA|nr:Hypp7559 [Branchiostoma lanceolatum]
MRAGREAGRLLLRAMSSSPFPHSEALAPYTPPPWAAKLHGVPKYRLQNKRFFEIVVVVMTLTNLLALT